MVSRVKFFNETGLQFETGGRFSGLDTKRANSNVWNVEYHVVGQLVRRIFSIIMTVKIERRVVIIGVVIRWEISIKLQRGISVEPIGKQEAIEWKSRVIFHLPRLLSLLITIA